MAKITSFRTVDAATGYQVGTVHLESFQKGKSAATKPRKRFKWGKPLKMICQWCDKQFTGTRFRLFCDDTCKKAACNSRGLHPWKQEELDFITDMIGTYAYGQMLERFRAKFGYTQKELSDESLRNKIKTIASSEMLVTKDRDDNLSATEWGKLLGVSRNVINSWVEKGYVKRHDITPRIQVIKRYSIKTFALQDPLWFDDISKEYLIWLFDGKIEPLIQSANLAVAESRIPAHKPTKVICLETQQIFKSIDAARKHFGLYKRAIKNCLETQQPVLVSVGKHSPEKKTVHLQYYFNLVHGWGKKYA